MHPRSVFVRFVSVFGFGRSPARWVQYPASVFARGPCGRTGRLSGAPVMSWVSFLEEGFAWTGPGGEPTWFETFPQICRGFCPKCGSSVASKGDEAGLVGVTI